MQLSKQRAKTTRFKTVETASLQRYGKKSVFTNKQLVFKH